MNSISKFDHILYDKFLTKTNKRPLFSCMWEPMLNPTNEILEMASYDKILQPKQVNSQHILNLAYSVFETHATLYGDLPFAVHASAGHQWLEAICGCKIMVSNGQIWATQPERNSIDDFLDAPLIEDWEDILVKCHSEIVSFADGRCFAAVPVIHGPLDILSTFLGSETLSYAFYDEPEKLKRALIKAGEVVSHVSQKLAQMLKQYLGGYCGRMHLYTKRACSTIQDDNSYLTSPAMFKEYIEPVERSIMSGLPSSVYHMHNTSLHLGSIIADYGLDTIQISVDPNGGPLEKQLVIYEIMKKKTPLVLSCWNLSDMEILRQNLTPQGLALTFIPAPDGCQINKNGKFDEFFLWQQAYENWIQLYL